MTCRYCGTELPEGALFCGECGLPVFAATSAVSTESSDSIVSSGRFPLVASTDENRMADAAKPAAGFSIADLAFSSPGETADPDDAELELPDGSSLDPTPTRLDQSAARCPQCGEPMAEGDVFCGECGFVVRTVAAPEAEPEAEHEAESYDGDAPTSAIAVVTVWDDLGEFPPDPATPGPEAEAKPESGDSDVTTEIEPVVTELEPKPESAVGHDADAEPDPESSIDRMVRASAPWTAAVPADPADPDLELDEPLPLGPAVSQPNPSPRSRPIPDPFPWGTDRALREDIEATRLTVDSESGTRYVLQFSTGESVTVGGSGLVGRNPSVQPGEYVDQLVPIFDASKSVSKTHLEFGQESGRFWVSDRYSTNGSVIRQPDSAPRRADPGRRYFIARGSRVDVGEQFFVVS